jgi:hypothetical protein
VAANLASTSVVSTAIAFSLGDRVRELFAG